MNDIKDMLSRTANCIYRRTEETAKIAKLSLEIESQKCRLSKVYEKIGEAVVSGSLASGDGKEEIFKFIDEAKCEKKKLCDLINAKNDVASKTYCKNCGKKARYGTYCHGCGEYVK